MAQSERQPVKHDTVMDVMEEQIARVYAKAFLGAASKSPQAKELVDEVESLIHDVLQKFPAFEQSLRSSLVSDEQKEQMLDRVFRGRASETVLNFLKVLARHRRLTVLRSIGRVIKKLYAEQLGLVEVEVRVAKPLDDVLRQEIYSQLKGRFGTEPVLNVVVDPSLIAGIVMRVGDRVFDASAATHFGYLRRQMVDRTIERIETRPEKFVIA